MKLYYSKGACSLAVRIILHEIGVPCEFESVNLETKKTQTGTDFFQINPKGAVPAIVVDEENNPHTLLTENAAIQQYLADKYGATHLLPSVGEFKRCRVIEWFNFVGTELHKSFTPFFNSHIPQTLKETVFKKQLETKLSFVNDHLKKITYLLGDQFTIADSYLFVVISWLPHIGFSMRDYTHIARYYGEIKKRKAVIQALKEEGFI